MRGFPSVRHAIVVRIHRAERIRSDEGAHAGFEIQIDPSARAALVFPNRGAGEQRGIGGDGVRIRISRDGDRAGGIREIGNPEGERPEFRRILLDGGELQTERIGIVRIAIAAEAEITRAVHGRSAPVAVPESIVRMTILIENTREAAETMHELPLDVADSDADLAVPSALVDVRDGFAQHAFIGLDGT